MSTPRGDLAPSLTSPEGVREAYAAHGGELYGLALRGLSDAGAAQDVVQETFLRAWRARERYDPVVASLRTWLFGIARNVIIDAHRARGSRPWLRELADHRDLTQAPAPEDLEAALLRRLGLEAALGRLSEDHRRALEETYLADRPYPEVAAELGIGESTLRSRVFHGLRALRTALEEAEEVETT